MTPPCHHVYKMCLSHRCRPKWICNTFISTTPSRVQRGTPEEGSTVIAPKQQPLISLNTNWCSMLTSFTLISGIKKNTGCNVWKGWQRGFGWAAELRKLSTNVASNKWWKGRRERERGKGKRKLCRGSHRLQGVREETERIEATRNRGIGRGKETQARGGLS